MIRAAALLLAAITAAGCLAPLEPDPGETTGTSGTDSLASPAPSTVTRGPGLLQFRLNASYPVGSNVSVVLHNGDQVGYRYRTHYAACDLGYYTASGRKFLIPEGTHCDLANEAELKPGETKALFVWSGLKECVRDNWGCSESRTLPAGSYRIHGFFETWDSGRNGNPSSGSAANVTFRIV